ncbi:type II secretion system protein [Neobacillus niacini]|uniref:type II secretion system protein n=1 Tax=Neobacillus niacini TaxID=86668 RepID=UPI00203C261E|nr:prepilin-type N-terminal cleavage/methylation domain-containing protein [Neobacillus niacini]
MKKDERGLTLIEVIVTLAILSIVSVIIWSVFFQGYKHSQKSISKNSIIQETNLLVTNLKKVHQTSDQYVIDISTNCKIVVTPKNYNSNTPPQLVSGPTQEFGPSKVCFEVTGKSTKVIDKSMKEIDGTHTLITIEPNSEEVELSILASELSNKKNNVTIKTYLYKMKGADYN